VTIVRHTILTEDQSPMSRTDCKVELLSPVAFNISTGAQLDNAAWATSDETGLVEFDLLPQSGINPAGSTYSFSVPFQYTDQLLFQVPDGAGPYNLMDILVQTIETPSPVVVGITNQDFTAAVNALQAQIGALNAGNGQPRFYGQGPPPATIIGSEPGDLYLDVTDGTLYQQT
jgi:hypothetical protein